MRKVSIVMAVMFAAFEVTAANLIDDLVPRPKVVERGEGTVATADALAKVRAVRGAVAGAPSDVAAESYSLAITPRGVEIVAADALGERYARTTLAQLAKLAGANIPVCTIRDWPLLRYRGFMTDCGRNYQSLDSLKAMLDMMARYKMNLFHWHLTDNHGWRLESKRHPELQGEKAFARHVGKFYAQEEFKELFAYAEARGILIVPELDMPGHTAAFRRGLGVEKMSAPGVDRVLCELIDELCSLVDAKRMPYVHLGTDEVWGAGEKVSPATYELWAAQVRKNGRTPVGWNPGHPIGRNGTSVEMVWGQQGTPSTDGNSYLDTTKGYYLNHVEPFATLFAAAYQAPCRFGVPGAKPLGAVLSYWHDVYSEGHEDQLAHANVFPAIILYADTFWCGRDNRDSRYWGRLPPADDPAFQVAVDLERRVEAQRTRVLDKTSWPFQFVPQTSLRWRMSDAKGRLIAKNIAQATVMPRHPLFKQENADFVGEDVDAVVLETWIKSPKAQTVGVWVGFTGLSRARGRTLPAKGEWGRHGARVEVNGEVLSAPDWKHPGESRSVEQPFEDEEYYMREPTPLRLKAGWNHVKLTVPRPPKPTLDDAWTATFIPVLGDSRHPESVPDLIYSCEQPGSE